jgi:metal-dependent amidase/aminoacylase/carboxypeptidase family protein
MEDVERQLQSVRADLIEVRRDIHRHPEVSGQEERTAWIVAERLRGSGLEVATGVGGHGVVGILRGGKPGPTVAYLTSADTTYTPQLHWVSPRPSRRSGTSCRER